MRAASRGNNVEMTAFSVRSNELGSVKAAEIAKATPTSTMPSQSQSETLTKNVCRNGTRRLIVTLESIKISDTTHVSDSFRAVGEPSDFSPQVADVYIDAVIVGRKFTP